MLVSNLILFIGVYAAGVVRLWRNAGYGRGVRPLEALAFATGWLALVMALSPLLDEWSEQWLAAHMVQHVGLSHRAIPFTAIISRGAGWRMAIENPAIRPPVWCRGDASVLGGNRRRQP